ncbi:MAG: hypothetical protein HYY01_05625 [Chloroflexi bacterium]|nr:hypothetical protein [Chloroflexota bacterium]
MRRFFAVFLGFFFVPIFLAVLLVNLVNGTIGNPRFYVNQLHQANIYNFIYDDLLPVALDEFDPDLGKDGPQFDMPRLRTRLLATARQTLPPEYIQAQAEQTITTVMPYFLGDTDSFTLTIPIKDRVKAGTQSVQANFLAADTFPAIYDPAVAWMVDQGLDNLDKAPFRLSLTREELDSSIRTVLPQDWLLAQTVGSLDAVVPYLTKETPGFTITVPLVDRVEAAKTVANRILSKPETYDFIMDEVLAPVIQENVGGNVALPFGVTVTQSEVLAAVKQVVPQAWLGDRLTDLLEQVAAYIEGRSPTIAIDLPLADRKAAAIQVITEIADRRLRELYDRLPQCTAQDLVNGVVVGGIPVCKPAGISFEDAKKGLGFDVAGSVTKLIGSSIPDQWTVTEASLREALGEDMWDGLLEARKQVTNGFTFTDADLKEKLGPDDVSTLEDVRGWVAGGFTFTDKDLQERLQENNGTAFADMDNARQQLGTARRWAFFLWVIPGLFLVAIGFLGGRNWYSRLGWAAGVLAVGAVIAFFIAGPAYSVVARPELQSALAEVVADAEKATEKVAAEKGVSMALAAVDAFVSGFRTKALIALLLGVAGVATAIVLGRRSSSGESSGQPAAPPTG